METFPESDVTEIEIGPDGRVFLFGASREVFEVLSQTGLAPQAAGRRLAAGEAPAARTVSVHMSPEKS
jgi:hypothetical protein